MQPGNQIASSHSAPDLWALLDRLPRKHWPKFLRGDCGFGADRVMSAAEKKGLPYLFKLKSTKNVKVLIERLMQTQDWEPVGCGFDGKEATLQLQGYQHPRRVVVLRKRVPKEMVALSPKENGQLDIEFAYLNLLFFKYFLRIITTLGWVPAFAGMTKFIP